MAKKKKPPRSAKKKPAPKKSKLPVRLQGTMLDPAARRAWSAAKEAAEGSDPGANRTKPAEHVPAPSPPPKRKITQNDEGLTPKQEIFVEEYLIDFNATRAAIAAGYSEKNADKIGSQVLGKTRVARAIGQRKARRLSRLQISGQRVLEELAKVGYANMRDFAEWDGYGFRMKKSATVSREDAAAIKGFTFSESESHGADSDSSSRSISFTAHDKVKALELLGKHTGAFEPKGGDLPAEIAEALAALDQEEDARKGAAAVTAEDTPASMVAAEVPVTKLPEPEPTDEGSGNETEGAL